MAFKRSDDRLRVTWAMALGVVLVLPLVRVRAKGKGAAPFQDLDRQFQSAVQHYEAGEYAKAQQELEPLAARLRESFEVSELMGLVYAAQGQDQKATEYLKNAVRLKPDSGAAHTNLATNLVRLGQAGPAEAEFKKAVDLEPASFDANHDLGEFYARAGKLPQAIPFLKRAQTIDPSSYPNGYDLSIAYMNTNDFEAARQQVRGMLMKEDTAELHNLLAEVEEKSGDLVTAANEYERAAHLDPSENNIFDWGGELLLHQAVAPAMEVFTRGIERYPRSARMQIGLGIALYASGRYNDAVKAFSRATDLDPSDPRPYQFLARAYDVAPGQADEVRARLRRFVELEPRNARARYDYAMSLWKAEREQVQQAALNQIESLLKSSITLDPRFADAHQQLGILYSDRQQYLQAIQEYQQAIEINPDLADAHYRLGQALVRIGKREQAQQEFDVSERLHKRQLADAEKQRAEIKQFIVTMRGSEGEAAKRSTADVRR